MIPVEGTQGHLGYSWYNTGTTKRRSLEPWKSFTKAKFTDHACDGGSRSRGRGIPSVHGCWWLGHSLLPVNKPSSVSPKLLKLWVLKPHNTKDQPRTSTFPLSNSTSQVFAKSKYAKPHAKFWGKTKLTETWSRALQELWSGGEVLTNRAHTKHSDIRYQQGVMAKWGVEGMTGYVYCRDGKSFLVRSCIDLGVTNEKL